MEKDFYQQVYDLVRRIPPGKIANYGQIAQMLGKPQAARTVGYALNALRGNNIFPPVPWQRVINYQGKISLPPGRGFEIQRELLEEEGIIIGADETYDFNKYRWDGSQ